VISLEKIQEPLGITEMGSNCAEHISETDHEYDAIPEIMDNAKLLENVHYSM